jgi:type IV pilus assembly protein PilC
VPDFWFSALTDAGEVQEGFMQAPTEAILEDQLRERGVFLIRSEERAKPERVRKLTDAKIDRKELLAFLEYVAGSFDVGIPILDTLEDVQGRLQSKKLRAIIGEIRYAVSEEGKSLSSALAEHPLAFPELYIGTIRAGEASGELSYALRQLVEYLDWQATISDQLRQATMYPIVVLSAVGLLVVGLLGFVFPKLVPLLQQQSVDLPLPTRIILKMSSVVHDDWLAGILTINATIFAIYLIRRTTRGRLFFDGLTLHIPVIGPVVRDVNMARIVTYLSLFYRTGVELVLSLTLVERIIANKVIARAVANARDLVVEGVSMAAAFGKSPVFPTIIIRSIALGEATGNIESALGRTRDYYGREIPAAVRRMITVLQPLLVAIIGGVILMVALAIILPILNIYNSIGRR